MTTQCYYRHCRRFIRGKFYCDDPRLCWFWETDRLALSSAMSESLRQVCERKWVTA